MRDYINIYKIRARLLLLLMAVVLVACSDDADRVEGETDTLQLVPYTHGRTEVSPSATRTVETPSGYSDYFGPNSIGVFTTTTDGEAPTVRTFSCVNRRWNSQVSVTNTKDYFIYGYMPVNENIDCEISPISGKNYSQGAVLTFTNLPPVLAEDFSVVSGVLQVDKSNPAEATGTLKPGNFYYKGQATGSNFVCLMLDHLYSAVQFKFLVNPTYNELRTIKLKTVEMKSVNQIYYPLVVTMKARAEDGSYEEYSVDWGDSDSRENAFVSLYTNENGETLSATTATVVDGYFVPLVDKQDPDASVYNNLELRCTYDVYDKNVSEAHPNGNLVRENCTAVNKLPSLAYGPNQRTILTLTVNPTYLYVLSEPDLDNPTVEVN